MNTEQDDSKKDLIGKINTPLEQSATEPKSEEKVESRDGPNKSK